MIDEENGTTQADDHQAKLCEASSGSEFTEATRDRLGELCALLKGEDADYPAPLEYISWASMDYSEQLSLLPLEKTTPIFYVSDLTEIDTVAKLTEKEQYNLLGIATKVSLVTFTED